MNKNPKLGRATSSIGKHKILTGIIIIACLVGGYEIYHSANSANAATQYVLTPARLGSLSQTVTGTGQVSASNQTNIQSQVSGTIETINAQVGQSVTAGQLIATIDSTNAAITLQNAKIALAKLEEPAKQTDISNATQSIAQSYADLYNSVSTIYLDLPAIMTGLNNMLYTPTGFLSDQSSSFLTPTAQTYRNTAGMDYDSSNNEYQTALLEYKNTSPNSATSTIGQLAGDTETLIKNVAQATADAQNTITFITNSQPDYEKSSESSAASSVNTWASQANSDLTSLISAENSVQSNENALTNLVASPDQYDIQAAELSLQQAQQTYDNYFIRAPYDGEIGQIPVNVYGQAGSGATIAVEVGSQKIATISLDEVDAAKVQVGQPVSITFNAIDNFTATGTVEEIDQVGTVTQGVVSYGVKILINTSDPRIKPGMSVNTTITTTTLNNAILVPTTAVKTLGNRSYVSVLNVSTSTLRTLLARPASGTSTGSYSRQSSASGTSSGSGSFGSGSGSGNFAGSSANPGTAGTASSSRMFGGGYSGQPGQQGQARTITVPSAVPPQVVFVTTSISDDTNTVILSGLQPGQWVVTKTISGSGGTTASAAAPSILNSLGGRGGGGGFGGGGGARPAAPARVGG